MNNDLNLYYADSLSRDLRICDPGTRVALLLRTSSSVLHTKQTEGYANISIGIPHITSFKNTKSRSIVELNPVATSSPGDFKRRCDVES